MEAQLFRFIRSAEQEMHVHAGEKIVLEAGSELTVKAGGSWLKLNAEGVHFGGTTINIAGGGSPGKGTEAEPLLPVERHIGPFVLLDSETGEPLPWHNYLITTESGHEIRGVTDQHGKTEKIYTDGPETVQLTYA